MVSTISRERLRGLWYQLLERHPQGDPHTRIIYARTKWYINASGRKIYLQPSMSWMNNWVDACFYALKALSLESVELSKMLSKGPTCLKNIYIHLTIKNVIEFQMNGHFNCITIRNQMCGSNLNVSWYITLQNTLKCMEHPYVTNYTKSLPHRVTAFVAGYTLNKLLSLPATVSTWAWRVENMIDFVIQNPI